MKIAILGYSGSGKSTFASELSKIYDIDKFHLDQCFFNPNWLPVEKNIFEERIQRILLNDNWIIDGNYSKFGIERIPSSDLIFIFDFNRFRCMYNIVKRRIKYNNKTRESAPDGCNEQIDFAFFKWILYESRSKSRKQSYEDIKNKYGDKVIIFKNHRQVNKYLKELNDSFTKKQRL